MSDPFWRQGSVWWAPVVILILSGAGWLIREEVNGSTEHAAIVGKVEAPPKEVQVSIDGKPSAKASEYGWYRIDNVAPGSHQIVWSYIDYVPKYADVNITGGKENRIDLQGLEPRNTNALANKLLEEKTLVETTVDTDVHTWFAGTAYNGFVDMQRKFGFKWTCSGGTCLLKGPYGAGLSMAVCQELRKTVGLLDYYYNDAGMKWSETENPELLKQCNSVAI